MSAAATYDTSMVLPRLRPDLVISRQVYRGQTSFVVKDPVALKYTRLGEQEIHFAGLLDGRRTFAAALAHLQKRFAHAGIDHRRVSQLLNLFARLSWVSLPAEASENLFLEQLERKRTPQDRGAAFLHALMLPFFFKFTLLDPDRILIRLEKKIRFLWTRGALVALGLLLAVGVGLVLSQPEQVSLRAESFFTLHNLLSLWFTMIAVKVVHEFGHGLTCKHYGGEVHEMGAMFIVFTPFLFCDATDSWMFPSKWKKICVNLGGIYFELWLAGLAAIFWALTQPGLANELALNVMFICSVSTLFFNINPLMRFDGYYVLADWLEVPNLRERSRQQFMRHVSHWTLGEPAPDDEAGPRWGLILFAIGSYLYTWVVLYRILGAIGHQLEPFGLAGAGQTLEVAVFGLGLVLPLFAFGKKIFAAVRSGEALVRRRLGKFGLISLGVLGLISICPWQQHVVSGCVIGDGSVEKVHAKVPGFVRELFVREGLRVESAQPVARLENRGLTYRLADVGSRIESLKMSLGLAMASEDAAALQQVAIEQRQLESLRAALVDEEALLKISTKAEGTVVTPNLERLNGLYLGEGDLVCEVMPLRKVRIAIALNQSDVALVRAGQSVELRFYGFPDRKFTGHVVKVFGSASLELAHVALSARAGGDIPTEPDQSGNERSQAPLYQAELSIENEEGLLRMGMTGLAKITCQRTFVGHAFVQWLRQMLHLDFQV